MALLITAETTLPVRRRDLMCRKLLDAPVLWFIAGGELGRIVLAIRQEDAVTRRIFDQPGFGEVMISGAARR